MKKTADYRGNPDNYAKVESIPGEQAMFDLAARILVDYSNGYFRQNRKGVEMLDLCCGTAPILERLIPENKLPEHHITKITGVDIDKEYLEAAKEKLYSRLAYQTWTDSSVDLEFVLADAVEYKHPNKVQLVLLSSAYHHIEDERKDRFLNNVKGSMTDEGIAVFGENFIRDFNSAAEYDKATIEFYNARIREAEELGFDEGVLALLERVKQYGLNREYEYKTSYRKFMAHLDKKGFEVIRENRVWPDKNYFKDATIGDFVIVVRKSGEN